MPLPRAAALAPQAEGAGRQQRKADHIPEIRPVAVPTNAGAVAVFNEQRVFECRRVKAGEARGFFTDRQEEFRYRISLAEAAAVKIVMPAKGYGAPFAEKSVKVELLEGQRRECLKQPLLLVARDHLRRILQALGEIGHAAEQISFQLCGGHGTDSAC